MQIINLNECKLCKLCSWTKLRKLLEKFWGFFCKNIVQSASLRLVRMDVKGGPLNSVSALTELQFVSLKQNWEQQKDSASNTEEMNSREV